MIFQSERGDVTMTRRVRSNACCHLDCGEDDAGFRVKFIQKAIFICLDPAFLLDYRI
jgi:hypothetical protein